MFPTDPDKGIIQRFETIGMVDTEEEKVDLQLEG
jgi:hypothetical protein